MKTKIVLFVSVLPSNTSFIEFSTYYQSVIGEVSLLGNDLVMVLLTEVCLDLHTPNNLLQR